ncbi:sodium/potassium-transporting ATPase subunit beta-like [Phymastichus coffea]|uniref:sodium/potassium-transporting ATPase subunit beta-like n=1 Tax=Phymastichus coffea TaxID=108790 RepID=UPI00273B3A18|nr:sodium/potassium-transporting ATPase subunit beta-like [Phymastichus coffea]
MLIKHDEEYYRQRKPQPDLGVIENFKRFLWDSQRRAFLDRTAQEWMNVGIFYLCFYGVLFSFTAFQIWLTYKNVACRSKPYFEFDKPQLRKAWLEPSRQNKPILSSLHGPGIAFKPNILTNGHSPRILIDRSTDMGRPQKYVDEIDKILKGYKIDRSKFAPNCDDRSKDPEKPCFFDIATLGHCSQPPFGYAERAPKPCVYFKINKRYGWSPIPYGQASILPEDMPDWLQSNIRRSEQLHVWLSCEGKSPEDKAKLGEIEYLPKPGFPVNFFPFDGQRNYLAPVVALSFSNLSVGEQVTVECKTWARNIDNEDRYNLNFKIMLSNS